jgi:hypothetical protein
MARPAKREIKASFIFSAPERTSARAAPEQVIPAQVQPYPNLLLLLPGSTEKIKGQV